MHSGLPLPLLPSPREPLAPALLPSAGRVAVPDGPTSQQPDPEARVVQECRCEGRAEAAHHRRSKRLGERRCNQMAEQRQPLRGILRAVIWAWGQGARVGPGQTARAAPYGVLVPPSSSTALLLPVGTRGEATFF